MPRLPRVNVEGALYYVTCKSGQGRKLFIDTQDFESYIELLAQYKKQYGFKLFAFVLLPAHIHLLIELCNDAKISAIMHSVNSLYTKRFNSRYHKSGHLFHSRFKSLIAEKDPYLLRLTRHIHLNPKEAGLIDDPKRYLYSSYATYLGEKPGLKNAPVMKEEFEEVFRKLQEQTMDLTYESYMDTAGGAEDKVAFDKRVYRKRFLGSKKFKAKIEAKIETVVEKNEKPALVMPRRTLVLVSLFLALSLATSVMYLRFYTKNRTSEYRLGILSTLVAQKIDMLKALQDRSEEILASAKVAEKVAQREKKRLSGSTWQIVLKPASGSEALKGSVKDTVTFTGRKFSSMRLASLGLPVSNYSITAKENGKVIWETMQTSADGTIATWYGEWHGNTMKGIVDVKPSGEKGRKYSFISKRSDFSEEM